MDKHVLTIRSATDKDYNTWDLVVTHPLQSWAWGEFRKSMGIDVVRLVIEQNKKIIDAWQVTFHKIPHTPWTIGYFPKGPLPSQTMIDELTKTGKNKRTIFIQLEPNVPNNNETIQQYNNVRKSHHPLFTRYTFVLDLNKSEEDLLKAMHPKTRYNIKIAQKHGVVVKEDNSKEAFETYLRLSSETTQRQGFYAHNETYHQKMWYTLRQSFPRQVSGQAGQTFPIARLWTASYNGEILVAWIIFSWNDTIYYPYGASSRNHKEVMAPYLLLWEIAQWGKRSSFKKFDLWGALGPDPDQNDPWYGFHRFKEGFSPQLVEFTGSYDLILRPFLYRTYTILDTLRWKILTMNLNL